MSFEEGRIVDDGGEQGREAPQQQGGEELGDDGVLQRGTGGRFRQGQPGGPGPACLAYQPLPYRARSSLGPMTEVQNLWGPGSQEYISS